MSVVHQMSEKFIIRMPDGMRGKLKDLARENRRSLNSQIVVMLENQMRDAEAEASA